MTEVGAIVDSCWNVNQIGNFKGKLDAENRKLTSKLEAR